MTVLMVKWHNKCLSSNTKDTAETQRVILNPLWQLAGTVEVTAGDPVVLCTAQPMGLTSGVQLMSGTSVMFAAPTVGVEGIQKPLAGTVSIREGSSTVTTTADLTASLLPTQQVRISSMDFTVLSVSTTSFVITTAFDGATVTAATAYRLTSSFKVSDSRVLIYF